MPSHRSRPIGYADISGHRILASRSTIRQADSRDRPEPRTGGMESVPSISDPGRSRNVRTQFTPDDARRFCDRFGCRQDTQGFYENPAINDLVKHADFEHARSVLEVGCGTGSFACRLFETVVPADARYIGLDISGTMIGLATRRLEPWQDRTEVDRRMAPWWRWSGTDDSMVELARKNAVAIAAGHSFILFLDEGFYPLNVLNTLKMVPEVCRIYCATANPTEVIIAETNQGRGVLGVVDGPRPRASRARTTSPGGRDSFGRSDTSCEPGRRPSGLLRGPHLDRHHDRLHIGAAALRATHLGRRARHARFALPLAGRYRELYDKQHGLEANLFLATGEGEIPELTETVGSLPKIPIPI